MANDNPQKVERTYGNLKLVFGPLKVGFVRQNLELMKKIGNTATSFEDIDQLMPIIYASVNAGMPKPPKPEAIDEAIDLLSFSDAMLAVLSASGFNLVSRPADARPGESLPAEG